MTEPAPPRRFRLLDTAALVVGYGLASLLVRAFWPEAPTTPFPVAAAIGLEYLWLGLAMSGPIVMAANRRKPPDDIDDDETPDSERPRATWAENAWILVGVYWICLTILVVPARLRTTRVSDVAFLGVFPILASIALGWLSRKEQPPEYNWTHKTAVWLILTWPAAWVVLILLGKVL
ncbi:hypothetical protein EP7_003246 [Isosphaeraceae bacterium EP7]